MSRLPDSEEVFILHSPAETMAFGKTIGSVLSRGSVLALCGELGSGKTTFIKGVGLSLGIMDSHTIHSPTFSYLHIYEGNYPLYHFDLYRLRSADEFLGLGFAEFLTEGICCIEWPEHASSFLPLHTLFFFFEHVDIKTRKLTLRKNKTVGNL